VALVVLRRSATLPPEPGLVDHGSDRLLRGCRAVPIVVHVVATTPEGDIRQTYETIWDHVDAHQIRHARGCRSHLAYLVGDAFHTADVWESREDLDAYLATFGPIADELGVELAGPPEVGELLDVVVPPP
jgi:hypothetical protein